MKKIKEIEFLIDALRSLPGVGTKNATKWAYFLINQDQKYIDTFIKRISDAHNNVKRCVECGYYTEDTKCYICDNTIRDHRKLCVVATVEDLDRFESAGIYDGVYHVTHGEISYRKNIPVEHINLTNIRDRVIKKGIQEVIIATNFTQDGEVTSQYIKNMLNDLAVSIYRIGFGIPLNSSVDYADDETLRHSYANKRKI